MELSIVIPAFNEAESFPDLLSEICRALSSFGKSYEILIVDDGSRDNSLQVLRELKKQYPQLRVVSFRKNYGKSAALAQGFQQSRGKIVVTMDADLQDDPAEIPRLIEKLEEGYDLVSGWKKKRYDPISKKLPSRLFNFVTARVTGLPIHDFNCGLKVYRREVLDSIQLYGELHRFLPALAHWQGFRISEIPVRHHPRKFGKTKFGPSRFFNGFFDLITVLFLTRFRTTPLHIFGLAGGFTFFLGLCIEAYLTVLWFMGHSIRNRPLFFLGILLLIVGIQFIVFGLLGEMLSAGFAENVHYSVKEEIE